MPHDAALDSAVTAPVEKPKSPDFTTYVLDKPTTQTAPVADQTATPKPENPSQLEVPPLLTPGWKPPSTDAPSAPGTPADNNARRPTDSDVNKNMEGALEGGERTDINQGQLNILNAAKDSVGTQLWKGTKYDDVIVDGEKVREGVVRDGKLGAAVSVSEVLKKSGVTESVDSPSIVGVEQQLKEAGFIQRGLADAKPGDVVVYQPSESNPSKRIGIVGDPNDQGKPTIYQMDRNGTWRHHEMRVPTNAHTKVYTPGCGE